jgi:cytochrome c553
MKKSFLKLSLVALVFTTAAAVAGEYDLKTNMMQLNNELTEIRGGLIAGDDVLVATSLSSFAKDSADLLSQKEEIINKFPKDMKDKKHKANLASEAARTIDYNVKQIEASLDAKNPLSKKQKREQAQTAYLNIVNACFQCHNVVRDK